MSDARQKLLEGNRAWSQGVRKADPAFFERLARQQRPSFLWIGCADSRVPANVIAGVDPGEIFVHRNVANVVVHSDLNCMSVVQFAVEVLEVRHVIVCGHYGCGGVAASLEPREHGLIDNWFRHIKDVHQAHAAELAAIDDRGKRLDRLTELHVMQQAQNVARTPFVQAAWARGRRLTVDGWIYHIEDGLLRDLDVTVTGPEGLPPIYRLTGPAPD